MAAPASVLLIIPGFCEIEILCIRSDSWKPFV